MHTQKSLAAIKAEHAVKRITFDKTEANPGETLYILVLKLNKSEVMVPGLLDLLFTLERSRQQLPHPEHYVHAG